MPMNTKPSRRLESRWRSTTRSTMAPTLLHAIPSSVETVVVGGAGEVGDELLEGLREAGFQARGPRHGLGADATVAALDSARRVAQPRAHAAHCQVSPAPRGLAIVTGRSPAARSTPRYVPARADFDRDSIRL